MEFTEMTLGSTRYNQPTARRSKPKLAARLALLPNFPEGADISYTLDDESLGNVTGHDQKNGRVLTRIGSFDPHDIKVLPPKRA